MCHVDRKRTLARSTPSHESRATSRINTHARVRCQLTKTINKQIIVLYLRLALGNFARHSVDRPRREGVWRLVWLVWTCYCINEKNVRRVVRRADRRFHVCRECRRESRGSHYYVRPVQKIASMAETRRKPSQTAITLAILVYTDCRSVAVDEVSCAVHSVRVRATGGCPGVTLSSIPLSFSFVMQSRNTNVVNARSTLPRVLKRKKLTLPTGNSIDNLSD